MTTISINLNSAAYRLDQATPSAIQPLPARIVTLRNAAAQALAAGDALRAAELKARELVLRSASWPVWA